jgi:hypothetical protein
MNYIKHYDLLIIRGINRKILGYSENHHIIPKCIGGTDDKNNLVLLTAEEHFLAHVLLIKIYPNEDGLVVAVSKMCQGRLGSRKRKLYGWLKERFSKIQSSRMTGKGNTQYGTMWINNGLESKKINNKSIIPTGWIKGRIILKGKSRDKFYCKCGNIKYYRAINCKKCTPPSIVKRKILDGDVDNLIMLAKSELSLAKCMQKLEKHPKGPCVERKFIIKWREDNSKLK